MESGLFFFDGSFRPVPLQHQYVGINEKKLLKQIKLSNEITYEKIVGQEDQNQVLVFVHSRKDTAKTAKALRDLALERNELNFFVQNDSATMEILKEQAGEHVNDSNLKDILPYGIGIHHAGLNKDDRTLCEDLFASGEAVHLAMVSAICSTLSELFRSSACFTPESLRDVCFSSDSTSIACFQASTSSFEVSSAAMKVDLTTSSVTPPRL